SDEPLAEPVEAEPVEAEPFGEEPADDFSLDEGFDVGELAGDEFTAEEPAAEDDGAEGFSFDDETFSFDDESDAEAAVPEAGVSVSEEPIDQDDIFGIPEGGEEIQADEQAAADEPILADEVEDLSGIEDDAGELGAFEFTDDDAGAETPSPPDESFSFDEPMVPGEEQPASEFGDMPDVSDGDGDLEELDTSGIDEFSLGDFGEEFGVIGDEVPSTEEDLNPALSVPETAPGAPALPAGELQISETEFESLQTTVATLPLNLKREVEEIITEAKGTNDQVEDLVRRLAARESPADIATVAGKILGKQIRIPRGYEKHTGLEFEAERQGFAYQFRENILPILRLVAIFAIALVILGLAGYHLVFRPLRGRSLYREGIALIAEDQYTLGNQTFERARKVWPANSWFYTYAEAFITERQYTLAGEKYEQLLFGMSDGERDHFNGLLNDGKYSSILSVRELEKQGILDYADLESDVLGNFVRADRLLQLILVQDVADYDGRLALGDNFMRWAETEPAKYEDARVAYARLMERYGQTDELLFRMLRYFVRTDNLGEVLTLKKFFQQDERLDIEPDAYAEMAGYLIDNNLLADIEPVLLRAWDTDPSIPEIHYNLARYYRLINADGEEESALSNARRLLEAANPLTSTLRGILVDTITRIGENYYDAEWFMEAQEAFGEAIEVYEEGLRRRVLSADPMYGRAYARLADIHYYIGRQYDDALRYFNDAEENGYDEPNLDYKQGFILYRNGQLETALGEFREVATDPSGTTNALLWATGNTYFRRRNYFAAEAYYRELLERVELQRDNIRTLLVDEAPLHQSVVEYLIRVNNNLGVTLNRLSEGDAGNPDLYSTALIYLTQSIEYSENYRRDPYTLARGSAVNLAYLNQRGILYPTPEYSLQIYNGLPEDLDDLVF
ncbi:MAG: hypothetical protein KOO61_00090, partial [Spirochaetales bacterium]|nr:hypothetical protein [Spirochaetales bacterium]